MKHRRPILAIRTLLRTLRAIQNRTVRASGIRKTAVTRELRCAGRSLSLARPCVMGILNLTPDSFSDGGRFVRAGRIDPSLAFDVAAQMVENGAAAIDAGGESTRPGATPLEVDEELRRVVPVIERLASLDVVVSVDTYKPEVAREALAVGAHLVNDVTGLRDPAMLDLLCSNAAGVCVMHLKGEPRTMQLNPTYTDVVAEVTAHLAQTTSRCVAAGVAAERILIDPGFGFGKTLAHNLELLRHVATIARLGYPVMVGVSRKGMIGALTNRSVDRRLAGSIAAAIVAVLNGALVVRTHDVAETVDALAVVHAVRAAAATE